MNQPAPCPELERAQRLAAYLREDPRNPSLLADACDAALAAGLHPLAALHMDAAQALGLDPAAWTFRRARLCLAQRRLDEAEGLLRQLQASHGQQAGIAHDLACVRLLQGAPEACRALLVPWLAEGAAPMDADALEAMQVLWLRASHQLELLDEAWQWVQDQLAGARLQPAACGVASLVALDLGRVGSARALADGATRQRPFQVEALVTRGTLALADGKTDQAEELLGQALQRNPEDGRTWSALGLGSLQARQWPLAQARFERALRTLPAHVGTWHALGWSRLLQQDTQGAGLAFEQALGLDRNFAESHGAVGLALALAGDGAQAQVHIETARRLEPGNVTGRYAQALLAGAAADRGRVLALVDRLLDRPGFGGARLSEEVRSALGAHRGQA